MTSQQLLSSLSVTFWSLYGRYAWDDHSETSRVSELPESIVAILQKRRLATNEWVLDAGCGTGNYALAFAEKGFCVIGTDFAAGMLASAQAKVTNDLLQRVSFQTADLNLPLEFPVARFDHIVSISVLQAVTNPILTLQELHRVLKPGGTLVVSLPKQHSSISSQSLGALIRYRIRHLERRTLSNILLVIVKSSGERWVQMPRWTMLEAQQMISTSGFNVIDLTEGRQIIVVAEKVAD
jgi:ubiquinone/menaquinone biosynthesis C-methylase UbiE